VTIVVQEGAEEKNTTGQIRIIITARVVGILQSAGKRSVVPR